MKKVFLFICLAAGLMSCTKDILDNEENNQKEEGLPMTFNVTVLETKAAKNAWEEGDEILVFFNGLATKYLCLKYSGEGWTSTSEGGMLKDSDFTGLDSKTLTAVHFPEHVSVDYADGQFSFTSDGEPVYGYYLYETGKTYSVDGSTVTATLSLGKPDGMVLFHVPDANGYTFSCPKIKPVACASVGTDGGITENVLQAGARVGGVLDTDGVIFAGRLTTTESAAWKFILANNEQICTLTRTRSLTAGSMYNFPAPTETGGTNWTVQNASDLVVDLGITVNGKKIKWAKYNLGADTETGFGDYLAWGELTGYNEGKRYFSWSNYYFNPSGDGTTFTKYTGSDYSTLEKEDDAAYAALGGYFRMPTYEEISALESLAYDQVKNYNGSGVNGGKFTGSNGNTIFLPFASFRRDDGSVGSSSIGIYATSSLNSTIKDAKVLEVGSDGYWTKEPRKIGISVRPVYVEPEM